MYCKLSSSRAHSSLFFVFFKGNEFYLNMCTIQINGALNTRKLIN